MTDQALPERLTFLEGESVYESFIEGRPMSDGHNTASYVISIPGHEISQDGTHGVRCSCGFDFCETDDHLIASDEPYYNSAPSYDIAKEMVRRWNVVAEFNNALMEKAP